MTTIKPGQSVTTGEEFNTLPIGSVLKDRDDWTHTKIQDADLDEDGNNSNGNTTTYVTPDGQTDTFGNVWEWGATLVSTPTSAPEDTMTTRPTIDFSGPSRQTARAYALEADSRVLKDESRSVLQAAARGEEVDAYALNAAVTDAMRSAATRHGQSMGRRSLATKIAHLGHIAQAVIENHADGLPAYDTGERSRLLEEVKPALTEARREVERLTARVQELTEERALLTQAASDERRRLCKQYDDLKASANTEVTRLHEEIDDNHQQAVSEGVTLRETIQGLTEDLTRHVALLEFVESNLLDEGQIDQCIGFTHGYAAAQRD